MSEEFGNNIVSVLDDEGNEHQFELLDAIETDDGRYVALLPIYSEAEAAIDDDGEKYLLFAEKAPWDYTNREKNIEKDDIVRILGYTEKVIKGFEIEDLCIANWVSD